MRAPFGAKNLHFPFLRCQMMSKPAGESHWVRILEVSIVSIMNIISIIMNMKIIIIKLRKWFLGLFYTF